LRAFFKKRCLLSMTEPNFAMAPYSAEEFEAGRLLFAGGAEFFHAAQALDHLPEMRGVEMAFAGRSNVGKSSLLNALTGRRALARVSHQPGRTRQLNFFKMAAADLVLVDMPGYGYAEAPKSVKRDWQGLMLDFLRGRPNLRRVFLLLDARVEVKASDEVVMELLDHAAVAYQLVLTKADAVKAGPLAAKQAEVESLAREHAAAGMEVLTTSSNTGLGMDELRAHIARYGKE
jgi:GTP-binding protein